MKYHSNCLLKINIGISLTILILLLFHVESYSQASKLFAIDITSNRVLLDSMNVKMKSINKIDSLKFKFDPYTQYSSTYDTRNGWYLLESDTSIIVVKSNGSFLKSIHKPDDVEGMVYDPVNDKVYCVLWKVNSYYFASLNITTGAFTTLRSLSDNSFHSATLDYEDRFYYIISDSRGLVKVDLLTGIKIDSVKYFTTNNCACNSFDVETGNMITKCIVNGKSVMQLYNPANKNFQILDTFGKYGNGFFGYGSAVLDQNTGKWYVDLGNSIGVKNIRTNEKMDTISAPFNRFRSLALAENLCYRPMVLNGLEIQNPKCFNGRDGAIKIRVAGGRKPLAFSLDRIHFDTSSHYNNLMAGGINIRVKDKNEFCELNTFTELFNPPRFNDSVTVSHNKCFNDTSGEIRLNIQGASPPFLYSLNHQPFNADSVFGHLATGNYSIIVKDNNACEDTLRKVVVVSPSQLRINMLNVFNVKCNGENNGEIKLRISGGVSPYNISSKNIMFDSVFEASRLSGGIYSFLFSDQHGCRINSDISITEPPPFHVSGVVKNNTCYGDKNGSCKLNISGGLPTDVYRIILNGKYLNIYLGDSINSLAPGVYSFVVSNQNDCKDSLDVRIIEPQEFKAHKVNDTTLCNGQFLKIDRSDLKAISYHTSSNTGMINKNDTMTLTQAGVYFFESTDVKNCKWRDTFIVSKIDLNVMHDFLIPSVASISDTVYAVNISMPKADKYEWKLDRAAALHFSNDSSTLGLRFNDTGNYKITLCSRYKSCGFKNTKPLIIKSQIDSNSIDLKFGYLGPMIQAFEVYSNPHDGQHFTIHVKLRDTASFSIYKLDPGSGLINGEMHFDNRKSIDFTAFNSIKSEVYYLKLLVGRESKVIKVVAVY